MSQYKDIGLIDRFQKIQDDVLLDKDGDEAELGIVQDGKVVEKVEEDEEGSEQDAEESKHKSTLREMVEKMTPADLTPEIPRLKEWEVPIVRRLIKKYKDDYKVP